MKKPSNTYVAKNIKLNTGKNLELVFKLAFYAIPNIILIIDSVNYTKVVFLSNSGCFKWNSPNLDSNVIIPQLSYKLYPYNIKQLSEKAFSRYPRISSFSQLC
jgi:hypothetical protein